MDKAPFKNSICSTARLNRQTKWQSKSVGFQVLTGAATSGTLGNFYASFRGVLTKSTDANGNPAWSFTGTLQMNDYWDFDPDPAGKKRPPLAEKLVRFANEHLKGKPFNIASERVPVSQNSSQATTHFNGGTYKVEPNRVAKTVKDASN